MVQTDTKQVTGKCTSKLFICLPKPLLPKPWIVCWHMKDRGMRCFLGAVPFSAANPDAVMRYAEDNCLSWVDLLTISSYSCLAAGLNPVCPTAAGQVVLKTANRQDCLLELGQLKWRPLSCAWTCMLSLRAQCLGFC